MENKQSFDDIISNYISTSAIHESTIDKEVQQNDENLYNSEGSHNNSNSDDEVEEITDDEYNFLKNNISEYCQVMSSIETIQSKIKTLKTELTSLNKNKTEKTKIILPFMKHKKIDLLEGKQYNIEVKYSSRLQLLNKMFILKCLKQFINDDEQYNTFINYMNEHRTRSKISNLKTSKSNNKN
jgi:hypothetical protein